MKSGLSASGAAKQWLALYDEVSKFDQQPMTHSLGGREASMGELLGALPPPKAWDSLADLIEARLADKESLRLNEIGLRLLAHTLVADLDSQERDVAELEKRSKEAGANERYVFHSVFEQLAQAIAATSDDPGIVFNMLERKLLQASRDDWGEKSSISVPNLVALAGAERAAGFLRRALTTEKVTLRFYQEHETAKLARRLCLELIEELGAPQWGLISTLDSVELYEAMEERFAKKKPKAETAAVDLPGLPGNLLNEVGGGHVDYNQRQAQVAYM